MENYRGIQHFQPRWIGMETQPTLELAYLRFQNAFGHGNILDVGKIINPVGNFIHRKHAQFNPLYGNPLIYDYRTNLRSDSYPTNVAEILSLKIAIIEILHILVTI